MASRLRLTFTAPVRSERIFDGINVVVNRVEL